MKNKIKIIVITVLIIGLIIVLIKDSDNIEELEKQADISITYFDGKVYNQEP